MAHSLSARKRVRQNTRHRTANRARKSQIKTQVKHLETALANGDVEGASKQLVGVVRKLDKTAATSTMHKRTAARRKSRLMKRLNSVKARQGL